MRTKSLAMHLVATLALAPNLATAGEVPLPHDAPLPPRYQSEIRFGSIDDEVYLPQALSDLDYLPLILNAYRAGDTAEADVLKSKLQQPGARGLAEWFAIRSGVPMGFERIAAFQDEYRDWPRSTLMRRRAEETLLASRKAPAQVIDYFVAEPPVTVNGRIALAFALKARGLDRDAAEQIRRVWREETFGAETEEKILDTFAGSLSQADHRFRMERFALKESWGAALRAAGRAGKDSPTLVKARLASFQGKKAAEKAFAAVPENLRSDPSYLFSRILFLRRSGNLSEAARLLAQAPRDLELLVDGDEWWAERRRITRDLLDKNDAKAAYDVASRHAAESPAQQIEAEFHAGWIALRFLNEPLKAAGHFTNAAHNATTPISIARATYWLGRATEAADLPQEAALSYRRAAERSTTYYGQLALEKLKQPVALKSAAPLSDEARKAFEAAPAIAAIKLLEKMGEADLALTLYGDFALALNDPAQLDALASVAKAQNNARAVLAIGKSAVQRGLPLDLHAYPLAGIPDFEKVGDPIEPAMVYAIARQESAFNAKAVSSAGARGLMQLMPATAKSTAQRFSLPFDLERLMNDPAYNATLGAAHLGELMGDWKGSHVLAFASYNAGGGNVRKWIQTYGDPREPQVDLVDWVERIPFYETRNYVQRVMENLTVYRQRLESSSLADKTGSVQPSERIE
ncbi:lytic transglycosylase domain-containing protein [Microvirga flavescens]|uniref:lytic transglycosylase domain-containing protein n=1 Tax=Microvirga flavescens TaxID=2249811 RepID=UPI001FE23506|nr:lytic transglycosylase domain-containing protein [Microvirga flavescens]